MARDRENEPRPPLPSVVCRRGVHLLGTVLWCDAVDRRDLCFLSSVRIGRPGQHRKVLCTEETATLLRHRGRRVPALAGPCGQPLKLGPLVLEMSPAGHLLGAAQLLVHFEGARVLYAGTVCTEALPTAPAAARVPADLVVAEARCVPPGETATTRAQARDALLSFVDDTLSAGATPVLLVDPLGPGQDVVHLLGDAGHKPCAHRTVYRNALAYRACGVRFPGIQRFRGSVQPGEVLVYPRQAQGTGALERLKNTCTALVGRPGTRRGDAGSPIERIIPYDNLSTAEQLVGWLWAARPQRVLLFGPQDRAVARIARSRGLEVEAASAIGQLSLFPSGSARDGPVGE